jgi:glycosyltransferase involved in cell wall biosynthesis
MQKRVLIISHLFPPDAGGGVYRIIKFCKYLPHFGWKPIVLTTKGGYYRDKDETLLKEIPADVEIIRTYSFEPGRRSLKLSAASREKQPSLPSWWSKFIRSLLHAAINWLNNWFYIPDKSIGWIFFAEIAACWVMRKKKIDLIFVSGNPFSCFLIANQLKRWSGIPYLLDFRDAWTLAPYGEKISFLKKKINNALEKRLLKEASAAIMATEPMRQDYAKKYTKLKDKFYTITNGFDKDDLKNVKPIRNNKFTVIHVGSLNLTFRRPEYFLQAFKRVINEERAFKDNAQAIFLGTIDPKLKGYIDSLSLETQIKLIDFLPHSQCLNYMAGADVLLLICGDNMQEQTGKVFEYMLMDKPILALARPEGAAAEIVKQSHRSSIICPPEHVDDITLALKSLYRKWRKKELKPEGLSEQRQHYSRMELTRKLAHIFDDIHQQNLNRIKSYDS